MSTFDLRSFSDLGNQILYDFRKDDSEDIYHYTSVGSFLGIIQNEELWFTDRFYLNDSTEGIYIFDLIIENIHEIFKDSELSGHEKDFEKQCRAFKEYLPQDAFKVYQVSFSLNPDSLALWNYYTKGSSIQGYNLGFNSGELCRSIESRIKRENNQNFLLRGKVIYDKSEQIRIIRERIIDFYNAIKAKDRNNSVNIQVFGNFFNTVLDRMAVIGTFFKDSHFAVEDEYRICLYIDIENGEAPSLSISTSDGGQKIIQRSFRESNGLFVPYYKMKYGLECIKSITVSPTLDYKRVPQNINLLFEGKNANKDLQIIQSQIPVRY